MCSFCPGLEVLFSNNDFTGSMPDHLLIYYIENTLLLIYVNSGRWGEVIIRLDMEIWEIGDGGTKKRKWEKGWLWQEVWGLLGFVAFVHIWVYFCCCSGKCLCQGLQRAGIVYHWHSRLVSGW
jgi:hypothetical protein